MSNNSRVKWACYTVNMSMAVISNLPPLLLLTFREMYGISYSELGLLIAVNFFSQLGIDIVFSFFSHRFNISAAVKCTPLLTFVGLAVYALSPLIFSSNIFLGLLIGTVVFSMSGGFVEVLISPVIAAIPAKDPDREMSKLHSVYAWASVILIVMATLFLLAFGKERWQFLVLLTMVIPLISILLFFGARIPVIETPNESSGILALLRNSGLWLLIIALFLSGASELVMAQWSSSYLEAAMGIPKVWGDIFGVALFSLMLALGRTLYAKFGKGLEIILLLGTVGATLCYLAAALTSVPLIGLLACALTGFCVSMLWPGTLLVAANRFSAGGIFIYAIMAASGDLGASLGPQIVGIVTDAALASPLSASLGLTPEQFGIKLGMLVGMIFPLVAAILYIKIYKSRKKY